MQVGGTGKTSEKINGGTDGYGDDNSRLSISPEADVTETAPFKNWFGDSKVVDENGKPLVVYHGTNWDGQTVEIITKLDKYGNVNADLVEITALISGKNKVVPPPKPLTEVVEAVAHHQEAGYLPSTNDNLPSSAENASVEFENSSRLSVSPEAGCGIRDSSGVS